MSKSIKGLYRLSFKGWRVEYQQEVMIGWVVMLSFLGAHKTHYRDILLKGK